MTKTGIDRNCVMLLNFRTQTASEIERGKGRHTQTVVLERIK
jgi:hypothetical protein